METSSSLANSYVNPPTLAKELYSPTKCSANIPNSSINEPEKYFDLRTTLYMIAVPPGVLMLIYTIFGGFALIMYLLGMATVTCFGLWFLNIYLNYESQYKQQSSVLNSNQQDELEGKQNKNNEKQSFQQQLKDTSSVLVPQNLSLQLAQMSTADNTKDTSNQHNSPNMTEAIHQSLTNSASNDSSKALIAALLQQKLIKEDMKNINQESRRLFEDLQNNPFTNLSTQQIKDMQLGKALPPAQNSLLELSNLNSNSKLLSCQCNLEKENFKLIIKSKAAKISTFLSFLDQFYQDLMKTEQVCGGALSRLGLPHISIIGQVNESLLFKDTFDDPQEILQSQKSVQTSYAFCRWQLIRKVFNEIGVIYAENALFYREGVISNIGALSDNVQNCLKQFSQRHAQIFERMALAEKQLLKMKQEYAKANQEVEEATNNYSKASQMSKDYQKVLQLEMKFKLAYKQMQDCASKVSDALDNMCETREIFQQEIQQMLAQMASLDRSKVEIFKSTLMSVVDTHFEFEVQIQTFFDECQKQSNHTKQQLQVESDGSRHSTDNNNDDFLVKAMMHRRNSKYKRQDIEDLIGEIRDHEISIMNIEERQDSSNQDKSSIGPKEGRSELLKVQVCVDGDNDSLEDALSDVEDDEDFSNYDAYSPGMQDLKLFEFPNGYQLSPPSRAEILSQNANEGEIIDQRNIDNIQIPDLLRIFAASQSSFQQQSRKTQLLIQATKDMVSYIKQMKDIISKYLRDHTLALANLYEGAKKVPNKQPLIESKDLMIIQQQSHPQLKISKDNNESVVKTWSSFVSNFKSYLHQYEILLSKLTEIQTESQLFLKKQQDKKHQIDNKISQQAKKQQQAVSRLQGCVAQLKYVQKQQALEQSPERSNSSGNTDYYKQYKQYYQKYENMKLVIQNPSSLIKIAYGGKIPNEDQMKEILRQEYQNIVESQKEYQREHEQCLSEYSQIQKSIKSKVVSVKAELIRGHYDRSKNSQIFFRTLMESIEDSMNDANEGENQFEEDFDMLMASESANALNIAPVKHIKGCPQLQSQQSQQFKEADKNNNRSSNISPDKKDQLPNKKIDIQNMDEELVEESKINKAPVRDRSQSQTNLNQKLNQSQSDELQQYTNLGVPNGFNFGGQINIVNNFGGQLSLLDNGIESAQWFSKALQVFYEEWKTSPIFQNFIRKEIYIVANKGRSQLLSEIEVISVKLHGKAPEFTKIQRLDCNPDDFLCDIDLSLRSPVEILISTVININWGQKNYYKIPLNLTITLKTINGKLRVFYSNDKQKGCWYGFVGKPVVRFTLDPVIGKDNKFYIKYIPKLIRMIEDAVSKKVTKYCLPNKRPLSIPITKNSGIVYPKVIKLELDQPAVVGETAKQADSKMAALIEQLDNQPDKINELKKKIQLKGGASDSALLEETKLLDIQFNKH